MTLKRKRENSGDKSCSDKGGDCFSSYHAKHQHHVTPLFRFHMLHLLHVATNVSTNNQDYSNSMNQFIQYQETYLQKQQQQPLQEKDLCLVEKENNIHKRRGGEEEEEEEEENKTSKSPTNKKPISRNTSTAAKSAIVTNINTVVKNASTIAKNDNSKSAMTKNANVTTNTTTKNDNTRITLQDVKRTRPISKKQELTNNDDTITTNTATTADTCITATATTTAASTINATDNITTIINVTATTSTTTSTTTTTTTTTTASTMSSNITQEEQKKNVQEQQKENSIDDDTTEYSSHLTQVEQFIYHMYHDQDIQYQHKCQQLIFNILKNKGFLLPFLQSEPELFVVIDSGVMTKHTDLEQSKLKRHLIMMIYLRIRVRHSLLVTSATVKRYTLIWLK
jgi:hypothetical protein